MDFIDLVNSAFVLGGAGYACANAAKLQKDKQVQGIFISSTLFFTLWAFWGIYYYWSLNQWISLYCNIIMAIADGVWVFIAWKGVGK